MKKFKRFLTGLIAYMMPVGATITQFKIENLILQWGFMLAFAMVFWHALDSCSRQVKS